MISFGIPIHKAGNVTKVDSSGYFNLQGTTIYFNVDWARKHFCGVLDSVEQNQGGSEKALG